jgi:hypothetical protein
MCISTFLFHSTTFRDDRINITLIVISYFLTIKPTQCVFLPFITPPLLKQKKTKKTHLILFIEMWIKNDTTVAVSHCK